ncbi:hypothetical protein CsSME_00037273 [Camellia sinensis var. sinensis]
MKRGHVKHFVTVAEIVERETETLNRARQLVFSNDNLAAQAAHHLGLPNKIVFWFFLHPLTITTSTTTTPSSAIHIHISVTPRLLSDQRLHRRPRSLWQQHSIRSPEP